MEIKTVKSENEIVRLIDLFIEVFQKKPYNEKWNKKATGKRLKQLYNEAKEFLLYAESQGRVVGLTACQKLTWPNGNHLIIEDLVVAKEYRGRGVGAALIIKLEKIAKKKGIPAIDILVNKKSLAMEFWKKQKYRQTDYVQFSKKIPR